MFVILTWCLLKNIFPPSILFIVLPTAAALVCGFGFKELGDYVAQGLKSVVGTATLVAFSAMFFTLMKEAGVFDPALHYALHIFGVTRDPRNCLHLQSGRQRVCHPAGDSTRPAAHL